MSFLRTVVLLSVGVTMGCVAPEADLDPRSNALRIGESTPEAFGILGLLNDVGTHYTVLDDEVGLDSRAATALIGHRDGPDGVLGTDDDDLYDTIAEVDDQYYVGTSALNKLLAYATTRGWIPEGGDVVGSWEDVPFTADEVSATLDLVNTATHAFLDDDLGLDRRAADGIVEGRPFADMPALADAYYVGTSALTALRDHVTVPDLAGIHEDCTTDADCEEGLVCLGAIGYGSGIFCTDTYGTFVQDTSFEIPDTAAPVSSSLEVTGLASVPVDVVLTVNLDHDRPSDLVLGIENFNGYGETLWANDASTPLEMVVRAFPSDDEVNGTYTLTFTDTVSGVSGGVESWELYIISTYD